MDKKYLNKVIDQIFSETKFDYEYMDGRVFLPYLDGFILFTNFLIVTPSYRSFFWAHSKNIYGLSEEETEYVWVEYNRIIKREINRHLKLD